MNQPDLAINIAAPPANFSGNLAQYEGSLASRAKVKIPDGFALFFVGSIAPTADQGPALINGALMVWDDTAGEYIGIDADNEVGKISLFAMTNPDADHWLICNGTSVDRDQFSKLFSVIGTTYGIGDGSTTFTLPNLAAPDAAHMRYAIRYA